MVEEKHTGRIVSGGASVHAAAGYAAMGFTHKGVKTEERPLAINPREADRAKAGEFMQEGIKADECPLAIISKEALAPCKCSALSKGYLFPHTFTMCRLPVVFLFGVILSVSFFNSDALDPNSQEGNCNYNMIGVAALSCQHFNESSKLPSVSCCTSLLHAIDELPSVGESGECCLCRYTHMRVPTPKLATSYISCHGKDMAYVANWTYPIQTCRTACKRKNAFTRVDTPVQRDPSDVNGSITTENALTHMDTPAQRDTSDVHGSIITKILVVAVIFLILLICGVCFCWSRQVRKRHDALPMRNLEKHQREMLFEAAPQTENRRSSGQVKERRNSSGRRRSLRGSPNV